MEEISILLHDLEDARHSLAACLTYFVAKDVAQAQVELRSSSRSPLAREIERVKDKFDGYLGDYLLVKHEAENPREEVEEEEPETSDGLGEPGLGIETAPDLLEEAESRIAKEIVVDLPPNPLGKVARPSRQQRGSS